MTIQVILFMCGFLIRLDCRLLKKLEIRKSEMYAIIRVYHEFIMYFTKLSRYCAEKKSDLVIRIFTTPNSAETANESRNQRKIVLIQV